MCQPGLKNRFNNRFVYNTSQPCLKNSSIRGKGFWCGQANQLVQKLFESDRNINVLKQINIWLFCPAIAIGLWCCGTSSQFPLEVRQLSGKLTFSRWGAFVSASCATESAQLTNMSGRQPHRRISFRSHFPELPLLANSKSLTVLVSDNSQQLQDNLRGKIWGDYSAT